MNTSSILFLFMATGACPSCGRVNRQSAKFCAGCGGALGEALLDRRKKELDERTQLLEQREKVLSEKERAIAEREAQVGFCEECGKRLGARGSPPTASSMTGVAQFPPASQASSPESSFCPFCGGKTRSDRPFCSHCGRNLPKLL